MGHTTKFLMLLTTTSPSPLLHHRCPSLLRLSRHRLPPAVFLHRRKLSAPPPPGPPTSSIFPAKSSRQLHTQSFSSPSAHFDDSSSTSPLASMSWPELSQFLYNLSSGGYFNRRGLSVDCDIVAGANLPEEFLRALSACLAFAQERGSLFGMLSRKDIEVIVENGEPFLFKEGGDSAARMRSFLVSGANNVLDSDKADMVDLMRYLLSYASGAASVETNNSHNKELVESSVRNLFGELAKLSYSTPESKPSGYVQTQFSSGYGQAARGFGQNIEMKRGDWICPRCSFMNFARNMKCLDCGEARPKRQLTGGEWECPQCDFFNYGRNIVCLRCDCKRPGQFGASDPRSALGYGNVSRGNEVEVDARLAANEEKAQRWFSKVSQLDTMSDMNSAIADEDFPEIMPLRKGVNRFVVSTRKTPLERRLANSQYQKNTSNDSASEGNDLQMDGANNSLDMKISRSLDEILGCTSPGSENSNFSHPDGQSASAENSSTSSTSTSRQYANPRGTNSNYVPFVPLPADKFAKSENSKLEEIEKVGTDNYRSIASKSAEQSGSVAWNNDPGSSWNRSNLPEKPVSQIESEDKEKEQDEKSQRWFRRVAELHNVTDLASAVSDDDFPEIMPMRKGENRFVVNKKKDRSLTSPIYKRQLAREQAGNSNYVPFVPFPPDYFAKKDQQPVNDADSSNKATGIASNSPTEEKLIEKLEDARGSVQDGDCLQKMKNLETASRSWNSNPSTQSFKESKPGATMSYNSTQNSDNPLSSGNDSWNSGFSGKETTSLSGNSSQPSQTQSGNTTNSWSGKSLEGSAVKEPDPLDMSEEAKAERWFRRVAQIKDISELSQIPDEDFPSIMPMRKGVNRFVVSKRKTPLERRLTSQQYRRNLPIVSSDPLKKESDNS